ncbi:Transcription initiation factor TFIIIB Brf1 subunit [Klebsormidium nitens]|uniref:Transcription initiation factor TFIIIB Brf1 subunit n=1 Tax=Klebsormidium nitens TaxID=105231 RepID=A0A1Y1I191_KLENI|nr:Transcription initiation factor TFIIIB Brf1 subunit [Klebsormidium nitens]|eukprot:GAQ82537.1 Transcription initiation factor TFIIIB Brf1 subunit [Klebsormidium nitens]
MVWCNYCAQDQVTELDETNGFTCCTGCGQVLEDTVYSTDPTFSKGAGGQSQVDGNFVASEFNTSSLNRLAGPRGRVFGTQADSHEKTISKGKHEITEIVERLQIRPREDIIASAHRLYKLGVQRNFTRGRRTQQVAAACLYIICRQESKPWMLIDFSDCLQTNVYVLGAVFLQLCRLLSLTEHPIMQKPVDPSLFIHRFADKLDFGERKKHLVANTALRLVASMKRDWMQTGRRPSGICGAALFIAAHIHGFERSKKDIVAIVHICEATLKKRLIEFEKTESGSLTAEEFEVKAKEFEIEAHRPLSLSAGNAGTLTVPQEVTCMHRGMGEAHYALGLCKCCYDEFIKVSGGTGGSGSAPPAFQRAEQARTAEELEKQRLLKVLAADDAGLDKNAESYAEELAKRAVIHRKVRRKRKGLAEAFRETVASRRMEQEMEEALGSLDVATIEGGLHAARLSDGSGATTSQGETAHSGASNAGSPSGSRDGTPSPRGDTPAADGQRSPLGSRMPGGVASPSVRLEGLKGRPSPVSPLRPANAARPGAAEMQSAEANGAPMVKAGEASRKVEEEIDGRVSDGEEEEQLEGEVVNEPEEEEDRLSDIDDDEVDGYLHTEEEVKMKSIIWEELHKEYLADQESKRAAVEAAEAAHVAAITAAKDNAVGAEQLEAAEQIAAAAVAAVRAKKERKKKEKAAGKEAGPAESAASATHRMLASRKLSSKVNYTVLAQLFKTGSSSGDAKGAKRKQEPVDAKQPSPWVQPGAAKKSKPDARKGRRVTFAEDGQAQDQVVQPKVGKSRLGRSSELAGKARTVASERAAEKAAEAQKGAQREPERGEDVEETARREIQQMEDLVPETGGYGDDYDSEYYNY